MGTVMRRGLRRAACLETSAMEKPTSARRLQSLGIMGPLDGNGVER